jgi:hypothetical protein
MFASAHGYLVAERCDFRFSLLYKPFHRFPLQQVIDELGVFSAWARQHHTRRISGRIVVNHFAIISRTSFHAAGTFNQRPLLRSFPEDF